MSDLELKAVLCGVTFEVEGREVVAYVDVPAIGPSEIGRSDLDVAVVDADVVSTVLKAADVLR